MWNAVPTCLTFERHDMPRAFARAWAKTGKRIAAKIAMIAITTSSSISVKPHRNVPVGAIIRRGGEAVTEIVGEGIEHVERWQTEDLVERAVHAHDRGVTMGDVAAPDPWADDEEHAPLGIDVVRLAAGIVLGD